MKRFYIWTGSKLIATDDFYIERYRHAFVYELNNPFDNKWRVIFKGKWQRRAKHYMPKEFLMHLLLMGVPT